MQYKFVQYIIMQIKWIFQESGMLRSTLYVVKCPEVMDFHEHVVCFQHLQYLALASYLLQPFFKTNCISYKL